MLKGTYTPVRNKCKMLKVVYTIKKSQNVYFVLLVPFLMHRKFHMDIRMNIAFTTVFTIYVCSGENLPEIIGCEKNYP
jgi:hypothetical protein